MRPSRSDPTAARCGPENGYVYLRSRTGSGKAQVGREESRAGSGVRKSAADSGRTGQTVIDATWAEGRAKLWKLDRLSRSPRDVLRVMERLGEAGAGFRSLTEDIDTTTAAGRMMMQMVGAFAEFERAMLKERTKDGLDAAREGGRIGERRPKLTPQRQVEIRKMVSTGDKRPPPRGCSRSIRPLSAGFLPGRRRQRGRPTTPNNVDGSTPINSVR